MTATRHNALTDPFIRTRASSGSTDHLTLPGVCAALAADTVASFPALRPHQEPAWHAFLVQIAAMALIRTRVTACPTDTSAWTRLLRGLTPDWEHDEPWCLVTPVDRPALLQPPIPDADPDAPERVLTKRETTPDGLDLLPLAKHHELKAARMHHGQPDDWLFALMSLQTQEGFMGAGHYGIARMNGGFSSRAHVGLRTPDASPGQAFQRDVEILAASTGHLAQAARVRNLAPEPSLPLLWTEPWDGSKASRLDASRLHPLTIEICRRVRLFAGDTGLHARRAGSAAPRVNAAHLQGNLADPWIPVADDNEFPKALSITADGFDYRRVAELLFNSTRRAWTLPLLARPHAGEADSDMELVCAAIARGQGKTEGFHRRVIPVPARAVGLLAAPETSRAERARERIDWAATVHHRCLRPALIVLVQNGAQSPSWNKPTNGPLVAPWLQQFERAVDHCFFPELWNTLHLDDGPATLDWTRLLTDHARACLIKAVDQTPHTADRHQLAAARARNFLDAALRKHLPRPEPETPAP